MCGIAAVLFDDKKSRSWAQKAVDLMLAKIEHRGLAALSRSNVVGMSVMGCVRLPIRSPIAGDQPSFNSDFTVAALLNGEIYNIDSFGGTAVQSTESDTAALPHLYRSSRAHVAQEESLLQCRGMYAIVLHDTVGPLPMVKLLRDHIGIKPLWLARTTQGLLIASEYKAFCELSPISAREVKPGELVSIEYSEGRWLEQTSRDVRKNLLEGPHLAEYHLPSSLRSAVSRAVKSQWPVEDLPVATLCSGGIDSSIITYELSLCQTAKQPVVAFTGYCADSYHSSPNTDVVAARHVCDYLKLPLREVKISYDDLFNALSDVIYHVETFEPNIVRNSAIQYHIFQRIAAEGFRVAYCGEGADELFYGYADFEQATAPEDLSRLLLKDLYRTQLQRVDRTSMAHTIEVRVPFLDEAVVRFASSLNGSETLLNTCGIWLGKKILREAYMGSLPDETILRRKATLGYGTGFGGVEMNDSVFNARSRELLRARGETLESVKKRFPEAFPFDGWTEERALYVHIYTSLGYRIPQNYEPPRFAQLERSN